MPNDSALRAAQDEAIVSELADLFALHPGLASFHFAFVLLLSPDTHETTARIGLGVNGGPFGSKALGVVEPRGSARGDLIAWVDRWSGAPLMARLAHQMIQRPESEPLFEGLLAQCLGSDGLARRERWLLDGSLGSGAPTLARSL